MKRHQLMHFVDTTMGSQTPKYCLLGDGIASLSEEMNAETENKQWINQANGTTSIKSYTPSFSIEREDCVDDDVRTWMKGILDNLPTGKDAETFVVRVDASAEKQANGYPAIRRKFAVSAVSTGGDAGGNVMDSVNFGGVGDAVKGLFNPESLKFTEG